MKIQIDNEVREATTAEIAVIEEMQAETLARKEAEAQTAINRTALLARLGITEEEAALLLGGTN
jgi:hypothetical protein